jgi:hypothetical protein
VVVLVALAVVLALLAGELIARPLAEEAVGRDVQRQYDLDQRPEVELDGFPFLVRVALGRLPSAEGRLTDSVVEGLRLAEAELRFRDVRFDLPRLAGGDGQVTAEGGTARVSVTDDDLSAFLAGQGIDSRVRFAPGTVEVTGQFTIRGVAADVTAVGELAVEGDQLRFQPTGLSAGGFGVDSSLLEPVLDQLAFTVELPRVAGVQLSRLSVEEGRITLSADLDDHVLTG